MRFTIECLFCNFGLAEVGGDPFGEGGFSAAAASGAGEAGAGDEVGVEESTLVGVFGGTSGTVWTGSDDSDEASDLCSGLSTETGLDASGCSASGDTVVGTSDEVDSLDLLGCCADSTTTSDTGVEGSANDSGSADSFGLGSASTATASSLGNLISGSSFRVLSGPGDSTEETDSAELDDGVGRGDGSESTEAGVFGGVGSGPECTAGVFGGVCEGVAAAFDAPGRRRFGKIDGTTGFSLCGSFVIVPCSGSNLAEGLRLGGDFGLVSGTSA